MALRHAPLLLALVATTSWAATPSASPLPADDAQCLSQPEPTRECYQLLGVALSADRTTIRGLQARVIRLQKELRHSHAIRRSSQEIAEANRVFDSEFGDLRKTPGAFALASDLVLE